MDKFDHSESLINAIEATLNSRKARRERIMCALSANPDYDFSGQHTECAIEAELLLDASDALDPQEPKS